MITAELNKKAVDRVESVWRAKGIEPNPQSRTKLHSPKSMNKFLEDIQRRVEILGCSTPEYHILAITEQFAESLAATWHGYDTMGRRAVTNYLKANGGTAPPAPEDWSGEEPGEDHAEPGQGPNDIPDNGDGQNAPGESQGDTQSQDDGQDDGSNDSDQNGESQGGEGDGAEGQNGQGEGGDVSDGNEDGSNDDSENGSGNSDESDTGDEAQQDPDAQTGESQGEGEQEDEDRDESQPLPPNELDNSLLKRILRYHRHGARNFFIHGPAGCGKTHAAIELADVLGIPLYIIASPQTMARITGFANAAGVEVKTGFTEGYTEECVIIVEEIDRAQADALIAMNAALANGVMDVPIRGTIHRHPNCVIIATGNTPGTGATDEYNTAQQLDSSTLDRFVTFAVTFDRNIEMAIAGGDRYLVDFAHDWRDAVKSYGLNGCMCSYRAIEMIHRYARIPEEGIKGALETALLKGAIPKDTLQGIVSCLKGNNRYHKALKEVVKEMED